MKYAQGDTIAAIATAPGAGAIGVIRLSGPRAPAIAEALCGSLPPPRYAGLRRLRDAAGQVMDEAVMIFFPAPHSFTGEDVVEVQGHGGPAVMDMVLERVVELGARHARPGEFSERAFLNGRMDLAQAEAVADLIAASGRAAARGALRSLRGEFSRQVDALAERLMQLRVRLEADFDFSDEDIDAFPAAERDTALQALVQALDGLLVQARHGERLARGAVVVLSGPPNVGKSSLLNRLADDEVAIVTPIPGTTRDLLRAHIELEGLSVEIIDTAGLRDSDDPVEREGMRRANEAIARADVLIRLFDDRHPHEGVMSEPPAPEVPVLKVYNKIDLSGGASGPRKNGGYGISALHGSGIAELRKALVQALGHAGPVEGAFIARKRHIAALEAARRHVDAAQALSRAGGGAELVAEELRGAQETLGEITGRVSSEDLLGAIFSTFCIGK